MTPAPTLVTPRLRLRPMEAADFPAYAAFFASPRTVHMGGPYGRDVAWGVFCHDVAGWTLYDYGALMIEVRGRTAGQVGISHGPRFPESELGWFLYDGFEGQGIATEAALALRDWAFARGLPTLVSYIGPDNRASVAVAERLGARLDPDAVGQDADDLVYRHARAS
jgi:RimJ/RimL family protein N-acetyltransferase